jgi:CHAT domain-containing protein
MPSDAFAEVERLRTADELLLEHAGAYLALNLFQEASSALERCEALFRSSEQPFELARTRYTQGLLSLYRHDFLDSRKALEEAESNFARLQNHLWANRTSTTLAGIDFEEGNTELALSRLQTTLEDARLGDVINEAISWDIASLSEARLLHARILLETSELSGARQIVDDLAEELGFSTSQAEVMPPLPHLYLRIEHLSGRIEQVTGNVETARQHFLAALRVMEQQRASLPLEEFRTAFLDDKYSIYGDLLLTYIEKSTIESEDLANAFNIVERARSRSLLERMRVTVEDDLSSASSAEVHLQRDTVRREVHWLYNQLLDEPVRQQDKEFLHQLHAKELALEQLEWRTYPLRMQAEPVILADFQRTLTDEEQAMVYFIVRGEVLAFVVSAKKIRLYRRLCTADEIEAAQVELRFQLGRVELGEAYLQRHGARLHTMVRRALGRLYELLVRPMYDELSSSQLRIIPYGSMHLLPFHAFWTGDRHLVEQFEFRYAPSASLAVNSQNSTASISSRSSFIGIAIDDESIPEARHEVLSASARFPNSYLYLDNNASLAGLEQAAADSDILHIATHGLFRPDNSFFSALKLADGWIDVREIYRLPLNAQLVVLSACESGAGDIRGADEVVGLARGFIGAGAGSLVVSLWNVHDAQSARFMECFYESLISENVDVHPAAALRQAQIAAIEESSHPYFWAAFSAVG